ncbi:nitrile hydratase accessory protein [Roseibacterium sp. SDUM158016]|uniref:nitrile hydratase accessory protein n=1 Tax=Roseicyclus sediminis TaxID=2980997 RepID=UPI0021D17593|nr:nitrile hydratase accessory protein [Roseibacterium sp. SDUM158016]MCU4652300.1 nitrile hydratase accessory protein [Roseibacterium sp. SDUM158016]
MNKPEAPFEEPWQAQLFALTVALNEAGRFSWPEWAEVFGPRVQGAGADHYWEIWSEALVALLEAKGIADAVEVLALTARWQDAARATPHGKPIILSAAD